MLVGKRKEKILETIRDIKMIKIYTGPNCAFCVQAKNLLQRNNKTYTELPIQEGTNLNEMLTLSQGMRTVPQIFIDDVHIGGYDQLREYEKSGQLNKTLLTEDGDNG